MLKKILPSVILLSLVALTALISPDTQAQDRATLAGTNPVQWRLVWRGNPSTTATLCWSTATEGKQHLVLLRAEGSNESQQVQAQHNGRYSAPEPELFFHHVQLEKLKPATKYHVIIESDGQQSSPFYFVTAPSEDVPISFLFGADSRSGHDIRPKMNAMLARMLAESQSPDRVSILALAHGGDFVYDGRNLSHWSRWMSDHELTTAVDGQLLPIIPARGNHDGGSIFNEVFAFPTDDANYYSVNLGPQAQLLTLNTETSLAGDQLTWLTSELIKQRPQRRWLLAQYHRPAFPAVKWPWHNSAIWVPLFEKHNVDLVCEGDGHNIKRTVPIRNFKADPTGVVYVGEGGLGVGQRSPKTHRWYLNQEPAKTGQGHHVQLITIDKQQLTCRVVLLGGEVFDEHSLSARQERVSTAVK